jgi:hypothetical protein
MRRGFVAAGILLISALPGALRAQPAPSACTAEKQPLAGLVAWVAAEGAAETLPGALLGRPEDEIPVRQKAYRNPATHLVRAVDVDGADGHCDVVFVVDDISGITTWVTDSGGVIARTFHLSGHLSSSENERVPNDRYVSEYETIKSYFLEKMPEGAR